MTGTRSRMSKRIRMGRPPKPDEERKRALPVMFDPATLEALQALSETEGISKGEIVRRAVRRELNRTKKK